jgi:hypothetical protein
MTDLTDRMRTCASYMLSCLPIDGDPDAPCSIISLRVAQDAVALLIEASNALTEKIPVPDLGPPVEITPQSVAKRVEQDLGSQWIAPLGPLPTVKHGTISPRVCPQCDSRTNKRVYRDKNRLMLACPVCGNAWQYRSAA